MTSGTPESTQNWVLAGFQNSLDLASMSPLEAKAMSSSATVTSGTEPPRLQRQARRAPPAQGTPAPLGTLHICAAAPGHVRTMPVWFNQTNTGCDRLVSSGSLLRLCFRNRISCHGFYQVILSAL